MNHLMSLVRTKMSQMSRPIVTPRPKSNRRDRIATVEDIRSHFPALQRKHNGLPVAYFDGPGGTQVPRAVIDAMVDYLALHNANTHWNYPTSEETDAIIAGSRELLAVFVGG